MTKCGNSLIQMRLVRLFTAPSFARQPKGLSPYVWSGGHGTAPRPRIASKVFACSSNIASVATTRRAHLGCMGVGRMCFICLPASSDIRRCRGLPDNPLVGGSTCGSGTRQEPGPYCVAGGPYVDVSYDGLMFESRGHSCGACVGVINDVVDCASQVERDVACPCVSGRANCGMPPSVVPQ